jgi:hypothetical protein
VNDREYAVRVCDTASGAGERIVPVGSQYWADKRVRHYEQLNATRGTYPVVATVVFRYRFMPDMPWEDAC